MTCKLSQTQLEYLADSFNRFQGGIFTPAQVEEGKFDPLLKEKLAVRRWDDQAKVPNVVVPGLEDNKDMAVRCLSSLTA